MTPLSDALRRLHAGQGPPPNATAVSPVADTPERGPSAVLAETASEITEASSDGVIRLYCHLSESDEPALLAAKAASNELIVQLCADGGRSALGIFDPRLDGDAAVRWPGSATATPLPAPSGVIRIRLALFADRLKARDWVLFLDDCRSKFRSTAFIARPGDAADWLAARCNEVCLVTEAGATDPAAARQLSARLQGVALVRPTCLLVESA